MLYTWKLDPAKNDSNRVDSILEASLRHEILPLEDVAYLLDVKDEALWQKIYQTALTIKKNIFGDKIILFAPLYLSNECINDCLYCGFRRSNKAAKRRTLTVDEAVESAKRLNETGVKRVLLVTAEQPPAQCVDYLVEVITAIYRHTQIETLSLNTAPMEVEHFWKLRQAGAFIYQCFQETYHETTYKILHPSGLKANFDWRRHVMTRAVNAGFTDLGMGVLLGLYDWRFDVYALIQHCHELINQYGFGPKTIAAPRLNPAEGAVYQGGEYSVDDEDFKKIVALYRVALPYANIVLSTREPAWLRDELIFLGVSQMSGGVKTNPGGYLNDDNTEQFEVSDNRTIDEIAKKIQSLGFIPTF
jgi:2-iminoacetate synthase